MAKLLLLVAIVIVVALLARHLFAKKQAQGQAAPRSDGTEEAKLVRCVECGAFVPKAEAVAVGNGFRCGAGCKPH